MNNKILIFALIIAALSFSALSLVIARYILTVPASTPATEFQACYNQCTNNGTDGDACVRLCGRHYSI